VIERKEEAGKGNQHTRQTERANELADRRNFLATRTMDRKTHVVEKKALKQQSAVHNITAKRAKKLQATSKPSPFAWT
jgi:hypothetical protein